jgi:hypothetical protein
VTDITHGRGSLELLSGAARRSSGGAAIALRCSSNPWTSAQPHLEWALGTVAANDRPREIVPVLVSRTSSLVIVSAILVSGLLPAFAAPPICEDTTVGPPFGDTEVNLAAGEGISCAYGLVGYVLTRVLSTLVPEYTFSFTNDSQRHGITWELAYEFRRHRYRHGLFGSFTFYPGDRGVAGRGGYRVRLFSIRALSGYIGAGGHISDRNGGPLLESRLRLGWIGPGGGGLFLGAAWQLGVRPLEHEGQIMTGIEAPF